MVYDDKRERIIQLVHIENIIADYTDVKVNKQNRCACPLHAGKDNNFMIYKETNSFYCFVCGAGGDVIKFVALLFGLSYFEAMQKIDSDYHLNVFVDEHLTKVYKQKRAKDIKAKRREKEALSDYQWFSYNLLINYRKVLERKKPSKNTKHDIDYLDRLLDKHLNLEQNPIQINVLALIRALNSKYI